MKGFDAVILPGGFAYGDYLRTGALAKFSPVMNAVAEFAKKGGLVFGICNGFQILAEAGLLPGALLRNVGMKYLCKFEYLRTETTDTPYTNLLTKGQLLRIPIGHGDGNYFADAEHAQAHRRQRPGCFSLRRCTRPDHSRSQSERIFEQHCGDRERTAQRAWHDAAPGPLQRGNPRQRRRETDF